MEENRSIENGETADAEATSVVLNEPEEALLTSDPFSEETLEQDDVEDSDESRQEEYERLVKTRFKELYARDVQKMINRRFRKYKVLEERYKIMEETLAEKEARLKETEQRIAEFDAYLGSEVERIARETEERVLNQVRARQSRPAENAISVRAASAPYDVSRLTRDERARIAKRAANGERIKF